MEECPQPDDVFSAPECVDATDLYGIRDTSVVRVHWLVAERADGEGLVIGHTASLTGTGSPSRDDREPLHVSTLFIRPYFHSTWWRRVVLSSPVRETRVAAVSAMRSRPPETTIL